MSTSYNSLVVFSSRMGTFRIVRDMFRITYLVEYYIKLPFSQMIRDSKEIENYYNLIPNIMNENSKLKAKVSSFQL